MPYNAKNSNVGAAMIFIGIIMGHIYLGTIGMAGAYQSMKTGYVDETWAREHHEYWYEDIKAGKIPALRSTPPEAAPPAVPQAPAAAPRG